MNRCRPMTLNRHTNNRCAGGVTATVTALTLVAAAIYIGFYLLVMAR